MWMMDFDACLSVCHSEPCAEVFRIGYVSSNHQSDITSRKHLLYVSSSPSPLERQMSITALFEL